MSNLKSKHSFFVSYKGKDFYAEGTREEIAPKLEAFLRSIDAKIVETETPRQPRS